LDNRAKYYIKDWLLNREDFSNYSFKVIKRIEGVEGVESDAIRNLSKINILVGSNNSGHGLAHLTLRAGTIPYPG